MLLRRGYAAGKDSRMGGRVGGGWVWVVESFAGRGKTLRRIGFSENVPGIRTYQYTIVDGNVITVGV